MRWSSPSKYLCFAYLALSVLNNSFLDTGLSTYSLRESEFSCTLDVSWSLSSSLSSASCVPRNSKFHSMYSSVRYHIFTLFLICMFNCFSRFIINIHHFPVSAIVLCLEVFGEEAILYKYFNTLSVGAYVTSI